MQFCVECGARLEINCPGCGFGNSPTFKFCGKCGHDLGQSAKAPTVDYNQPQSYTPKFLADDVANYTAMAEKLDPEEVHRIMDGCFKILMNEIHTYEGTINQFTGDGIMALFGAPVALEVHAQQACYAALSIQKAIEKYGQKLKDDRGVDFLMRIGINSGHVVVGSIGDDLRMDYTAVGDTTNLASRMESEARPGSILVSRDTHKLARDFFDFEPLDKVEVKGKAEAQQTYRLIKAAEVETRIEAAAAKGLTKFVGRLREVQTLKEAYAKARSGAGQVAGLVGEAGMGKSRLLLELRNVLPQGECTYLEGRCLHYGSGMAYLPLMDILRSCFNIDQGNREFVIKKKLQEALMQLDEQLKTHLPALQEILSMSVDDEKYPQLDPGQRKIRIFEAIRDVLLRESRNRSLVLAVEDLHWIDKPSEEFLSYLIDWLPNARILLVLLYRPEYTHQWGSKSFYSKIGVDQLSRKTSAELVQVILEGGETVPELRKLIFGKAGGNPLFLEEFTHSLVENGSIQKKDHQFVLSRKVSEIQVPDTVQGIIAARIDRLEESLKRVMQVASVIGREFAFRILQTIMGLREELKSRLLDLQGLEFIHEKRLFPELEYIFKHAITREVAYNSLLVNRKKQIHEKIGVAIEALYSDRIEEYYELLAYHYGCSDNKEKTWEYLDFANRKAARLNAIDDAKAYFDQAMQFLDSMPDTEVNRERRISLLLKNFDVFELLFMYEAYHQLLKRYEHMVVDLMRSELLGAFYTLLGSCEWAFSQFDQAIQTLTKAIKFCDSAGDVEYAALAHVTLQWCYLSKADFDQVLDLKKNALDLLERQFNLRSSMYALTAASYAHQYMGCWNEAISEAQKALKIGEEFSDNSVISFAASALAYAYVSKLDFSRAIEYGTYAVAKAPTPMDKAMAQVALATAWCKSGELDKGIQSLTAMAPMVKASNFMPIVVAFNKSLGEGYLLDGMYDKAKQTLEESVELAKRYGIRFSFASAHRILGEIARKTAPDRSSTHFEKSITVLKEIKAENELALAYAGYGRLFKQQGRIEKARKYLNKSLEILQRLGTQIEPEKVRKELDELPQKDLRIS
jgi:predicted ATPase/class 3 adenylate cyclase